MRKINARSFQIFLASAVITALVLFLAGALVFAENNTEKTGLDAVSDIFSVRFSEKDAVVTVNDRSYNFSLSGVYDFFESKALYAAAVIWFML